MTSIEQLVKRKRRTALSALLLVIAAGLVLVMPMLTPVANGAGDAGPDLTAEISLNLSSPGIGEQVTVEVVASNIGTSNAASQVRVLLYIDPTTRPPTTSAGGFPVIQVPGLNAGATTAGSRTHTFTTSGCDHIVYAWVDPDNTIAESDESNNLIELPLCVGVECQPDGYEQDNMCSAAGWITENTAQARSFCHATDKDLPDEDWIKFTAFAGVTYTVGTSNTGIHADPQLTLYNACDATAQAGPTAGQMTWHAPASGVYYAKLAREGDTQGPLTAYSLTLSSATGISDDYEPDNGCAAARDITTDGVRQTHLFQAPGDEDWVKFAVNAGESFIAIADNTATGVNPLVTVFSSCSDANANNSLGPTAAQVTQSSSTAAVYFVRVKNQNANIFGAAARYDLSVTTSACAPDAEEEDDNAGQAKPVSVGAAAKTHIFCPASDEDWFKFTMEAGKTYVIQTSNLAFASDTVLHLYNTDGVSELAQNDDYGYGSGSRIVWAASSAGDYYVRVHHANPVASGPNTQYDVSVLEGVCQPDSQDSGDGDNGPGDAVAAPTNGSALAHNFCADPLNAGLGDQDWLSLNTVAGGNYQVVTSGLGPNSDPVLELYGSDGSTKVVTNDDSGTGRGATLNFTPTIPGTYYVRVRQYNANVIGNDANYNVQVFATEPPTPTPTDTPTPTPTPTPSPSPTPPPSTAQTLILVNRTRVESIYGASKADALMAKLFQLADDPQVSGLVLQVETDPAVASAYAAWTADAASLADNPKANDVIAAIRNRLLTFAGNAPQLAYVIVAGDDRIIPFRRVLDKVAPTGQSADSIEEKYAPDVLDNGTVNAALAANMILTDDFLVDKEPSQWEDKQHNQYELYFPDYAVSRLVEDPDEIMAFIDNFLAGDKTISTSSVLITGYDFLQDSATIINTLYSNDQLTTDSQLIAPMWPGGQLRTKYLVAAPRFDIYSINGHSTHLAQGVPDKNDITASEVTTATTDLTGALVYSVGCHGGLNDPGVLDLPQAFMRKLANYVGNTGFGWGGSGVVYSEALMRNYSRELLRDTTARIGPALVEAKKKYYAQASTFNAYDAKILMQVTLYGLPMVQVTSGGALTEDDPFPSAEPSFDPPSAFGPVVAQGSVGYQLPGSFGAFGADTSTQGVTYNLDDNVAFAAGDPVQPLYFADVSAPAQGDLRGVVFLGGVYSDVVSFDPVIALADNEYVTDETEPTFTSDTFYPALPFTIRNSEGIPGAADTVVMSLGQFQSNNAINAASFAGTGVNRIFDQMSFSTYYSNSPDRNAANIAFLDGVLDPASGLGQVKVEAQDSSGILRVVVAYHERTGQGQWQSKDLTYEPVTQKWTTVISGTANTEFFVQVVDNAGNVAINNNKGRYYPLAVPLPLAPGRSIGGRVYLPVVVR